MMTNDLRELEAAALEAQRDGRFYDAIPMWNTILARQPTWEHGYAHYYLADCYTRTGQISLAEDAYRMAIAIAPEDTLFSDTLNSLLEARRLGNI
jgi:tetratricopeptide (TPR) repeat protein